MAKSPEPAGRASAARRPMSRREWAFAIVTMLASSLLALACLEGFIRFQKRHVPFQPDPDLIRSLRPRIQQPDYVYETEDNLNSRSTAIPSRPSLVGYAWTNNVGLRMRDDVGPKRPDERRILLLGDSYTEGLGVPQDARFSELAERELAAAPSSGTHWRIINAGIQNGAPSQYILQLRRYIDEFRPDVVIVCLAPNDLTDDSDFERANGFVLDPEGYPLAPKNRTRLRLLKNLWILRYLEVFLQRYAPRGHEALFPPTAPDVVSPPWPRVLCTMDVEMQELFRKKTGRYLVHLKEMAERGHAKFGVLMIHYGWLFPNEPHYASQIPPDLQADIDRYGCPTNGVAPYSRFVKGFLDQNGIPFRDPYDALLAAKAAVPSRKLWHFYDYHFSPAGHQVVGHELAELLKTLM